MELKDIFYIFMECIPGKLRYFYKSQLNLNMFYGSGYTIVQMLNAVLLSKSKQKQKILKIETVRKLAKQMLSGLAHLHSRGVAHRDLHGIVIIFKV